MGLCRFATLTFSPLALHHRSLPSSPPILAGIPSRSSPNHRRKSPDSAAPTSLLFRRKPFTACVARSAPLSSMETPPEGYRRNVGICLINDEKKVFAATRLDLPNSWQMPQGGIDEAEDLRIAAFRELREETGVSSAEFLAETPHWVTYDFPPKVREKLNLQWGTDWKGQAQKWVLFKFTGKDEEINLLGDGTEKPEFGNWSWVPRDQMLELAVDFKKPVYEKVLEDFGPFFDNLE